MVRNFFIPIFIFSIITSVAAANSDWSFKYKKTTAEAAIYSGSLADPTPPSNEEKKISFHLQGNSAKEIFDQLKTDHKNSCSSDKDIRIREKGDIRCIRYSRNEYSCYFGFDLINGKSIEGSIC